MNIYLILIIILAALAVSDLIVGVSNDAVNFLNSAIGAKAGSFKTIMIVAALGIILGATFSSGMMEVARKGIFHPQYFYFSEIMLIFMAVMITDIILLDMFNTYGMPTSTTVSIVFELLGAAVAIALFKISANSAEGLSHYINSGKALMIISGILLSIVVSFFSGAIIQFISRSFFSFDFKKKMKYWGAIWGGIAITAITYFILIKGLKGSAYAGNIMAEVGDLYRGSILTEAVTLKQWVKDYGLEIIGLSFISWTVLLQLLYMIFKIDIMRLTVLAGTFALAMAFAGNDLVNFIGVPLAGFASYQDFMANPGADPGNFLMDGIGGKVQTPIEYLIVAGLIMVVTLWTSKKARSVIKTSLNLSRQDEGDEDFGASPIARGIVRSSVHFSESIAKITPAPVQRFFERKFDQTNSRKEIALMGNDAPAFDMVRASVNLVVASIVISIATSYKLPLSTTYVTFMVAMGTSLADRAWGRESAVFRITGVLSVILGWFFTAMSAFTVAFVVAIFLHYTGMWGIAIMIAIILFLLYRSHLAHKKKTTIDNKTHKHHESLVAEGVITSCNTSITETLSSISNAINNVLDSLYVEDRKKLKETYKEIKSLNRDAKALKKDMPKTIERLQKEDIETGHYYVQVLDFLREMAHSLTFISQPAYDHVENKHKSLSPEQIADLKILQKELTDIIQEVTNVIIDNKYDQEDAIIEHQQQIMKLFSNMSKQQIKRIKNEQASTKASFLYFSLIHESKNLLLNMINLLKAHRDFIQEQH
ncbi:MAG: phosphate permease [Bacteroidetes bacterium]|nr:MAG: phosphate permease [Bacteroidota bacterium]